MAAEPQAGLAHELIHATRMAEGDLETAQPTDRPRADPRPEEEKLTVAAENEVREQWGLVPRERHEQDFTGPWQGEPSPLQRPGRY